MNLDRIKKNIKALLDTASDETLLEGETANALAFARRLMLKHNVDPKDLEEARGADEIAADVEATEYGQASAALSGKNLSHWESSLGRSIARLVGTVKFYISGGVHPVRSVNGVIKMDGRNEPVYAKQFVFYGPAADSRDAASLFEEWRLLIYSLGRMKYGGALRGIGRSYCEGFAHGIASKLAASEQAEDALALAQKSGGELPEGSTRSGALMVLNATAIMEAKRERADDWLRNDAGVKLGKGRASYRNGAHNEDAFGEGLSDGRKANLSRTRQGRIG